MVKLASCTIKTSSAYSYMNCESKLTFSDSIGGRSFWRFLNGESTSTPEIGTFDKCSRGHSKHDESDGENNIIFMFVAH